MDYDAARTAPETMRRMRETRRRSLARLQDAVADGAFDLELLEEKRNCRW
ncbi:hypothetical protein [Nocardia amamiensis]|nr:hypothetical protein [Nocardia amamiensis]